MKSKTKNRRGKKSRKTSITIYDIDDSSEEDSRRSPKNWNPCDLVPIRKLVFWTDQNQGEKKILSLRFPIQNNYYWNKKFAWKIALDEDTCNTRYKVFPSNGILLPNEPEVVTITTAALHQSQYRKDWLEIIFQPIIHKNIMDFDTFWKNAVNSGTTNSLVLGIKYASDKQAQTFYETMPRAKVKKCQSITDGTKHKSHKHRQDTVEKSHKSGKQQCVAPNKMVPQAKTFKNDSDSSSVSITCEVPTKKTNSKETKCKPIQKQKSHEPQGGRRRQSKRFHIPFFLSFSDDSKSKSKKSKKEEEKKKKLLAAQKHKEKLAQPQVCPLNEYNTNATWYIDKPPTLKPAKPIVPECDPNAPPPPPPPPPPKQQQREYIDEYDDYGSKKATTTQQPDQYANADNTSEKYSTRQYSKRQYPSQQYSSHQPQEYDDVNSVRDNRKRNTMMKNQRNQRSPYAYQYAEYEDEDQSEQEKIVYGGNSPPKSIHRQQTDQRNRERKSSTPDNDYTDYESNRNREPPNFSTWEPGSKKSVKHEYSGSRKTAKHEYSGSRKSVKHEYSGVNSGKSAKHEYSGVNSAEDDIGSNRYKTDYCKAEVHPQLQLRQNKSKKHHGNTPIQHRSGEVSNRRNQYRSNHIENEDEEYSNNTPVQHRSGKENNRRNQYRSSKTKNEYEEYSNNIPVQNRANQVKKQGEFDGYSTQDETFRREIKKDESQERMKY